MFNSVMKKHGSDTVMSPNSSVEKIYRNVPALTQIVAVTVGY